MTSLTALAAIKAAYPAQYYGIPSTDGTSASSLVDVWNGGLLGGGAVDLLSLESADTMAPLTAAQWALASAASVSGVILIPIAQLVVQYPARFYCDTSKPCAVYDMWGFSTVQASPAVTDLMPITAAEYADRQANYREQYYDTATGALADYVAPVVVPTLSQQATTALSAARTTVYNNYGILNEDTPDAWVTYLKALMAIANGTDTTSTALPSAPAS